MNRRCLPSVKDNAWQLSSFRFGTFVGWRGWPRNRLLGFQPAWAGRGEVRRARSRLAMTVACMRQRNVARAASNDAFKLLPESFGTKPWPAGFFKRENRIMVEQNFQGSDNTKEAGKSEKIRSAAGDAFDKASDMARDAREKAKRAASDTASSMTDSVVGRLAKAMRLAADDLSTESPLLAGVVRSAAGNVGHFASRMENQTVDQLAKTASDYTRRQPALVFGLAALAGFFAFRTFKNAQSVSAPPIQPTDLH